MPKGAVYVCAQCDAQFPKWSGRCTGCGAWGSVGQEPISPGEEETSPRSPGRPAPLLSFAETGETTRAALCATGLSGLDTVLGGGLVDGSVTLLAGEPGIGKSTLLAQLCLKTACEGNTALYVTGEESPSQIRRRLERLVEILPAELKFLDNQDAATVAATLEKEQPALTIVDSIQTMHYQEQPGEPGSVGQIKCCASLLASAAKRAKRPLVLVGQVTKDGDVAGPRVLEHLVDTVLFMEGDRLHRFRVLRALKHRFGPTDETSLLAMTEKGLEPVEDISTELLRDRAVGIAGSSVSCLVEGHRPALLEIQSLVSPAGYGTPLRRPTGLDSARLGMILAVLARRAGIHALDKDVYVNAAGGIEARDPSVDLAIATAIASASRDTPLDPRLAVFGEIGLAGELRPVRLAALRLKEIGRMGFTLALVPKGQAKEAPKGLEVKEASSLREAFQMIHLI